MGYAPKKYCRRGHERTPENTYTHKSGRQCIACNKMAQLPGFRKQTRLERIMGHVQRGPGFGPNGDCWEWTSSVNTGGYGTYPIHGASRLMHRYFYELASHVVPGDLWVLHKCDNRRCVRPSHLFLGTPKDNAQDKVSKGRDHNQQKTHCKRGHVFTSENTRINSNRRVCRQCCRERVAQERAALKANKVVK